MKSRKKRFSWSSSISNASFDLFANLGFSFLAMGGKAEKILLVGPKHRFVLFDVDAGHNIVKVDDHILGSIAHDDNEASLFFLDSIADEGRDSRVDGLARHVE